MHFLLETLWTFPFLLLTYLALEAIEAHAGGKLERLLKRAYGWGPLAGALSGVVPQCGFSAAAASLFAGGAITAGALVAVFLSTSDELLPILASHKMPAGLLLKIAGLKVACGAVMGFAVDGVLRLTGRKGLEIRVEDLCAKSRCHCGERKGIFVPALIHSLEVFAFVAAVSAAVHFGMEWMGEDKLQDFIMNKPGMGELVAAVAGLVPNCAVSVMSAELYMIGGMSGGALMAGSLVGSGVGWLVLFRTNRRVGENLALLATVTASGVVLGHLCGYLL